MISFLAYIFKITFKIKLTLFFSRELFPRNRNVYSAILTGFGC